MNVAVQPQNLAKQGEEIPVINIADFLAGKPGARERCAMELRHAYEDIGFWFVAGHKVPQSLVDDVFSQVARFHAQPMEDKLALKIDQHNIGYLAMGAATTRHSTLNRNNKPNLNEAYFVKRDLPLDHPDVVSGKRFRGPNQWPKNLPGFRETINAYTAALENLALSIVPLYATALDLPADYFEKPFRDPQFNLRMSHYPHVEVLQENEFGLAPHTDTGFMTLLAQNRIPGLALLTASGRWIDAPAIEGTFLVNSGDMLRRWSNDRFRATPHRVVNRSGGDRYAIPFFFDCNVDHVMECLPSCTGPGNPPKYPPTTYMDYMSWYQKQNYDHARTTAAETAAAS